MTICQEETGKSCLLDYWVISCLLKYYLDWFKLIYRYHHMSVHALLLWSRSGCSSLSGSTRRGGKHINDVDGQPRIADEEMPTQESGDQTSLTISEHILSTEKDGRPPSQFAMDESDKKSRSLVQMQPAHLLIYNPVLSTKHRHQISFKSASSDGGSGGSPLPEVSYISKRDGKKSPKISAHVLDALPKGNPTLTSGTITLPPGVEKLLTRVSEKSALQFFVGRADISGQIQVKCISQEDVEVIKATDKDIESFSSSTIFHVGEGDHFYIPGTYFYSIANNGNRDALLFFSVLECV